MRIWYIHPYSGTPKHGMSFRPFYLAKHFNKLGHEAIIVSSSHHHLSSFPDTTHGVNQIEGVSFYLQETINYRGNGLKRLLNMISFGSGLFGRKFREFSLKNIPDVIIASTAHPFHIIAAKYYAKKYKAKLILEVRDIWPLSLQEIVGIPKYHPLSLILNFFQKYGYKNCDHCVSLLDNSEEFFVREGLSMGKFTLIPNGVELEDELCGGGRVSYPIEKLRMDIGQFETVIGYTGAIGVPNNLMPLIEAANLLQGYSIGIVLVGDGIQKQELIDKAKEYKLSNVIFVDRVVKADVPHIIECCDAMFINALPKPIYRYGISPNKIFDYMLHDKVVFNGIDSPGNPLERAGCEIKFSANDHESLARQIIQFHECKSCFSPRSSDYVKNHHSYIQLAKNYLSLMERLK